MATHSFTVEFSDEDWRTIERVAEVTGKTVGEVISGLHRVMVFNLAKAYANLVFFETALPGGVEVECDKQWHDARIADLADYLLTPYPVLVLD